MRGKNLNGRKVASATGMSGGIASVPASKNLPGKSMKAGRPTAKSPKRVPVGRSAASGLKVVHGERVRGAGVGKRAPLNKTQATRVTSKDRTRG